MKVSVRTLENHNKSCMQKIQEVSTRAMRVTLHGDGACSAGTRVVTQQCAKSCFACKNKMKTSAFPNKIFFSTV